MVFLTFCREFQYFFIHNPLLINHDKLFVTLDHGSDGFLQTLRRSDFPMINQIQNFFVIAFFDALFYKRAKIANLPFRKYRRFLCIEFVLRIIHRIIVFPEIVM